MLYETAARSAEVLGLDAENPHRQRPTRHGQPAHSLAIPVLRLTGKSSIAAALRYHARRPGRPLQMILNC
jgi:hypothetical protein